MNEKQIIHDLAMACLIVEGKINADNAVERYVNNINSIRELLISEFNLGENQE